MAWTYIPGSGKISLEGVEFEMTDGGGRMTARDTP